MWLAHRLLEDDTYRELALKDLTMAPDEPLARPVVLQLAGNDPKTMLEAAQLFQPYCDAVGPLLLPSYAIRISLLLLR